MHEDEKELRSRFLGLLADKGIDLETRLRVVDSLVIAAELHAIEVAAEAASEAYWNAQEQA